VAEVILDLFKYLVSTGGYGHRNGNPESDPCVFKTRDLGRG